MHNHALLARAAQAWRWLTLGGRLHLGQPWALLIGPAALIIALIAPYQGLFVIAYSYMLLVVAMYLWVRMLGPQVRLRRRLLAEWAQVGDELEEEWELENRAALPLLWLEIDDASTLPGYTGRRVAGLGAGIQQQWRTSARCTRRGVFTLGPLSATLGDPFGLFRYSWREAQQRQIVIYPPLLRLPPLRTPEGQRGGLARADLLQVYVTPSVGGLREYAPGDPPSRIHWPTVARTGRLMIKEFDQERAGAFWIALDLYGPAYPPEQAAPPELSVHADPYEYTQSSVLAATTSENRTTSPLELAVALACSLAAQALAEGRTVGLLANDGRQRLVMPGRGPRQLWRILGALVDAQASGALPLAELLRQGLAARAGEAAGTALAVVTPALDGAWLPALAGWQRGPAGGVLALLVAAPTERAGALEARLASAGVVAHSFEVGAPLPLLNPPKPKSSARLSPLGKVMRG